MRPRPPLAAALMIAAAVTLTMPAAGLAQSADSEEQRTLELTREKFDAFIGAAVAVIDVRNAWQPRIRGAGDQEEAEALADEARAEMAQAVEEAPGISTAEYVAIAQAAEQNKELARAIEQRIRAAAQSGG